MIRHNSVELKSNPQAVESFKTKSKEVVDKITSCISTRFSSFTDDAVLAAVDILAPGNYPTEAEALAVFGVEQINTLIDHFHELLVV